MLSFLSHSRGFIMIDKLHQVTREHYEANKFVLQMTDVLPDYTNRGSYFRTCQHFLIFEVCGFLTFNDRVIKCLKLQKNSKLLKDMLLLPFAEKRMMVIIGRAFRIACGNKAQRSSHRFPWVLKINQKRIWHRIFIWVNVTHVTGFTICLAVYFSYEPIFNHSSSIRKHRNLELAKPWVLLSFFDANFNRDEVECVQKVILDKTMNLHCGYIPQVVSFCTATYQL